MGIHSLLVTTARCIRALTMRKDCALRIGILVGMSLVTPTALAAPPTASAVSVSGTPEVPFTLTGSYVYSDVDGDLEGASTFRWLRNGAPIVGAVGQNYTLVAADVGALIVFEVTPVSQTDLGGQLIGAPVQSAAAGPIAAANVAPTATGVGISGTAQVGFTLIGQYTYNDADGDPEGASTFRWLRGAAPIAGATSTSYTLVAADQGSLIRFEVTPVALTGASPGSSSLSPSLGPIAAANVAPQALSVAIAGTPALGETLTGTYTYFDADGDVESGTSVRWLRGGAPIPGATTSSYVVAAADVGSTLTFEVTPAAATGISPGVPATAQIDITNTPPTITGQQPLTTAEDTALTLELSDFTVVDPDSAFPGSFSLSVQNGANYSRSGNTVTPAMDFVGDLTIPVVVNDGQSNSPVFNATANVTAVNDRPSITGQQSLSTPEEGALTVAITDLIVFDPDNAFPADFSFELQDGADYTRVNDVITPDLDFNGQLSVPVTVSDGSLVSAVFALTIDVTAVNDLPTLDASIGPQNAVESSPFSLDVSNNFSDVDNEPLQFSAVGLPPSGNIQLDGQTGELSGTPLLEDAEPTSVYDVVVTATDVAGAFVSDTFQLTIAALDRANVALTIDVAPAPALINDELQWSFVVNNPAGPQAASNVQLDGTFIGAGLSVTAVDPTACTISPTAGETTDFRCNVGSLAAGASTTLQVATTATVAGHVNVLATAAGLDAVPIDPNPDDNSEQLAAAIAETLSNGSIESLGSVSVLSLAAGDVNGDGFSDLIVGTGAGEAIQIFVSDGFRSFVAGSNLADTSANNALALADIDNNGTLDLIVANGGGAADMVYANDGTGSFSAIATLASASSRDVATGDFNADGNADLVIATSLANPVYFGDGLGGFGEQFMLGAASSTAVGVADLNGDGREDIVFANSDSDSQVWMNGIGGFTPGSALSVGTATAVAIGEFGGGALPDLVFGRLPGDLGEVPSNPIFVNDGSGGFGAAALELGMAPTTDVQVGDIDRDGRQDLLFVNLSGVHQTWLASATGFQLYREQIADADSIVGVLAELGVADAGDDGGVDLALGGANQAGVGLFLNDGLGNLGRGDAVVPVLTLLGDATVSVPSGTAYSDAGASAADNVDGDISAAIVATSTVNTAIVGSYTVTYNVADMAGNQAEPVVRTVRVEPAAGGGGGGGASLYLLLAVLLSRVLYVLLCRLPSTKKIGAQV